MLTVQREKEKFPVISGQYGECVNHPDTFNQVLWQKGSTVTKDRHF
jgi:hypothetical protein